MTSWNQYCLNMNMTECHSVNGAIYRLLRWFCTIANLVEPFWTIIIPLRAFASQGPHIRATGVVFHNEAEAIATAPTKTKTEETLLPCHLAIIQRGTTQYQTRNISIVDETSSSKFIQVEETEEECYFTTLLVRKNGYAKPYRLEGCPHKWIPQCLLTSSNATDDELDPRC